MGFFDRNLSEREGLMHVGAGFVGMTLGLFVFIMTPVGIVVSVIGLFAVAEGVYRWSLFKAFSGGG